MSFSSFAADSYNKKDFEKEKDVLVKYGKWKIYESQAKFFFDLEKQEGKKSEYYSESIGFVEDGYVLNLDLNSKSLLEIPKSISKLTRLEKLYLHNNKISDISGLSSLVNLGVLYLSENKISDISELSSLVNLEGLYLSDNEKLGNYSKKYNSSSDIKEMFEKYLGETS